MPGGRVEAGIAGVKDMVGAGGNILHGPVGGRVREGGWRN